MTIAEVNGPAIAWGTCLAISCDFRVVSAEARSRGLEDGVVSPAGLAAETLRLAAALGVRDGTALRIAKRQCELRRALRNVTLDWGGLELTTAYYGSNGDGFEGLAACREARSLVFARESGDIRNERKTNRK